jgi:hypothetical protein
MSVRNRKIPSAKTSWPVTVKHPKGEMDGLITLVNPNGVLILCSRPLKLLRGALNSLHFTLRHTAHVSLGSIV